MHNNQWITFLTVLCVTVVAVHLVSAGGGHGGGRGGGRGGGHGGGHGHHGHGHGHGGRRNRTQCYQAQQFFSQWWPQSELIATFQTVCGQVGSTQAWTMLQSLLGVPATGVLDQATFQALLNNANHALLAQQLLASLGVITTASPIIGK